MKTAMRNLSWCIVTFVSMDSVGGGAGLEVKWDKAGKRAQYDGWNTSIAVRLGSKKGILDGKMVKLESAPFISDAQNIKS